MALLLLKNYVEKEGKTMKDVLSVMSSGKAVITADELFTGLNQLEGITVIRAAVTNLLLDANTYADNMEVNELVKQSENFKPHFTDAKRQLVLDGFAKVDTSGDQSLSITEMTKWLEGKGYRKSDIQFFDTDEDNKVSHDEMIEFFYDLSRILSTSQFTDCVNEFFLIEEES